MDTTTKNLLIGLLSQLVRTGLKFVGGWLVASGLASNEQADALLTNNAEIVVGILLAGIGLALSAWKARKTNAKIEAALDAPAGTPREVFEQKQSVKE